MIRSFSIGLALALGFGLTSLAQVPGCTNILACNFDFLATQDDGSCNFCCEGNVDLSGIGPTFCGCTDPLACNWDPFANLDDASCQYCCPLSNDTIQVFSSGGSQTSNDCGCTNPNACNYDPDASIDDGSCHFLCQYCKEGTIWDDGVQGCIVAKPSDSNFDGCVQLNDLLDLLTAYGDCGAEESPWQCGDPLEYQGYDYETVQIGEQCWFAENLRSESYENGDAIPSSLSNSEWSSTGLGATTVYEESASNLETYGRLYNWYAVADLRGLCPSGWHIPTDGEWMTTEMALGMSEAQVNSYMWRGTDQGEQMKATYGWNGGGNGTNSSGFSGLPGGFRQYLGTWYNAGLASYWWSSSSNGSSAIFRNMNANFEGVYRADAFLQAGYSVRCIKD